jgi:hypothetical protein
MEKEKSFQGLRNSMTGAGKNFPTERHGKIGVWLMMYWYGNVQIIEHADQHY